MLHDSNREIISSMGNAVPSSETASNLYKQVLLHHEELIKKPGLDAQPSLVIPKSWSTNFDSDYDTSEEFNEK